MATSRRVRCAAVAAALAALVTASAAAENAPPGATARCRDGTYSYSQHHSGTCSSHGGVAVWLDATSGGAAPPPSLGGAVGLTARSKTRGCVRGALPDRRCSPGAYYSRLTREVLCSGGFRTSTIRNVPQSEKYAVEIEYGMPAALYGRTIEIDHIVPLELGGANSIGNLFPEPGAGAASYRAKDRLENRLHAMLCAGEVGLRAAQTQIAANWETLYRRVFGAAPPG